MKLFRYTFLMTCTLLLLMLHSPVEGAQASGNKWNETTTHAIEPQASEVLGKTYTITVFSPNNETSTSTVSFFDDGFLQFSAFNGFGTYMTIELFFWGSFWSPDYYDRDVLITFFGLSFGPYISATGIVTDISTIAPWFFLGHVN